MPATNYDELKQAITVCFPAMSKQLQGIARFVLERPDELALGTVAAIAGAAGVQPSAMVRFANALDFGGFSEMQQIFRGRLVERSVSYRERIEQMRQSKRNGAGTGGQDSVLHQSVSNAIAELGQLEETVTAKQFHAAVRLLAGATQIHVLAQRRAFPVACYLAYALSQLELRTHLLDSVGGMLTEFVRGIAPREVLIAVSFRNYSAGVVEAAAQCHRRGVPVIAITDSPLSPLKPSATIAFELGDDSSRPFRSLVAPLCLAQELVVSTGHHLAGTLEKRRAMPARTRKARA
ncbi:MAG: MurR/RpiR family transcriptional regulator [Betaproteobacteria bacterium]